MFQSELSNVFSNGSAQNFWSTSFKNLPAKSWMDVDGVDLVEKNVEKKKGAIHEFASIHVSAQAETRPCLSFRFVAG